MCSGSFSQNLVTSQYPATQSQSQSQIGEDVLALCTGQFYDNKFVSQFDSNSQDKDNGSFVPENDIIESNVSKDNIIDNPMKKYEVNKEKVAEINNDVKNSEISESISTKINYIENKDVANITEELDTNVPKDKESQTKVEENKLLTSLLDELNEPELMSTKPRKYFANNDNHDKENAQSVANIQLRKKFIIDSDDEENNEELGNKKRKKMKKKKIEQRALQISGKYSILFLFLLTNVYYVYSSG